MDAIQHMEAERQEARNREAGRALILFLNILSYITIVPIGTIIVIFLPDSSISIDILIYYYYIIPIEDLIPMPNSRYNIAIKIGWCIR